MALSSLDYPKVSLKHLNAVHLWSPVKHLLLLLLVTFPTTLCQCDKVLEACIKRNRHRLQLEVYPCHT